METFIPEVLVETAKENEHFRMFHMRHKLVHHDRTHSSEFNIRAGIKEEEDRWVLSSVAPIFNDLTEIKGIKSVAISPYEITVIKAAAYGWEEIYPAIRRAMEKYLPST